MIKARFSNITKKISYRTGSIFSKLPVSPVGWTMLSIIPAGLGVYYLSVQNLAAGLILFIIAGGFDLIDGAVARVKRKQTNLGAFLDGTVDRFVEFLLITGLFVYKIPSLGINGEIWLLILLSAGTFMTSFVRAYADHKRVLFSEEIELMGGILERPERLIILYAAMFAGLYNPVLITAGVAIDAVLAVVTVLQRIRFVAKYAEIYWQ